MRTLLVVALLTPLFAVAAPRTESRKIDDFTALEVSGGVTLEVKRGATGLTIEGEPEILVNWETVVRSGKLVVRRKTSKSGWHEEKVSVRVTTPSLEALSASGGVDAVVTDVATSRALKLKLSGGVKLQMKGVRTDSIAIEASGGVETRLEGAARSASVDTSGGVNLDARDLQLTSAMVDASGGCNLSLRVSKSLKGQASGGVSLDVSGEPAELEVETSGGATVDLVR
ncbi:MAG: head GIN domain-containing protein [Archangium sp.]